MPLGGTSPDAVLTYGRGLLQVGGLGFWDIIMCWDNMLRTAHACALCWQRKWLRMCWLAHS